MGGRRLVRSEVKSQIDVEAWVGIERVDGRSRPGKDVKRTLMILKSVILYGLKCSRSISLGDQVPAFLSTFSRVMGAMRRCSGQAALALDNRASER